MKMTLEFELPEDQREATIAMKANSLIAIIHSMDTWLRQKIKYEDLEEKTYSALESTRMQLWDIISEYNCEEEINE